MRHTGDIKLRLSGDTTEAQKYVSIARTFFGSIARNNITLGLLPEAKRRITLANGVVITVWPDPREFCPLVEIYAPFWAPPPVPQGIVSTLRWFPEGIRITPRRYPDAPYGWGLPQDPETGEYTVGGALPAVLINKTTHNYYPDRLFKAINPRTVGGWSMGWRPYPPFLPASSTTGIRDPRINSSSPPAGWADELVIVAEEDDWSRWHLPQITPQFKDLISLSDTENWHAHRAQTVDYLFADEERGYRAVAFRNDVYAELFHRTNEMRSTTGLAPLLPPIRGFYNITARAALVEAARSKVMAHESAEFRPGFQTPSERALTSSSGATVYRRTFEEDEEDNRATRAYAAENLAALGELPITAPDYPREGADLGLAFAEAWFNSPPHYENIIFNHAWEDDFDSWKRLGFTAVLELAVGSAILDKMEGGTSDQLDLKGEVYDYGVQVFSQYSDIFEHGDAYWRNEDFTLSWDSGGVPQFLPIPVITREIPGASADGYLSEDAMFMSDSFTVYFRGRKLVGKYKTPNGGRLICAAVQEDEEHGLLLKIAYLEATPDWDEPPVVHVGDYKVAGEYGVEERWINTLKRTLPQETCGIQGVFSPGATRLCISVHVREPHPDGADWLVYQDIHQEMMLQRSYNPPGTYLGDPTRTFKFPEEDVVLPTDDYVFDQWDFSDRAPPAMASYGTSIQHLELIGTYWSEKPKQEVMVSPVEIRRITGGVFEGEEVTDGNVYHVEANDEYDAIPAYDGERLKFLRIRIQFSQRQWYTAKKVPNDGGSYDEPILRGGYSQSRVMTFVFPDGTEKVMDDTKFVDRRTLPVDDQYYLSAADLEKDRYGDPLITFGDPDRPKETSANDLLGGVGFESIVDWVDPLRPEDLVYTRVDAESKLIDASNAGTYESVGMWGCTLHQETFVGDVSVAPRELAVDPTDINTDAAWEDGRRRASGVTNSGANVAFMLFVCRPDALFSTNDILLPAGIATYNERSNELNEGHYHFTKEAAEGVCYATLAYHAYGVRMTRWQPSGTSLNTFVLAHSVHDRCAVTHHAVISPRLFGMPAGSKYARRFKAAADNTYTNYQHGEYNPLWGVLNGSFAIHTYTGNEYIEYAAGIDRSVFYLPDLAAQDVEDYPIRAGRGLSYFTRGAPRTATVVYYKDQRIVAGVRQNVVHFLPRMFDYHSEEPYYLDSPIDFSAILDVEDISKNVYPIGVL